MNREPNLKTAFAEELRANNVGESGKAASYLRALELLDEMLKSLKTGFEDCQDIWAVSSPERLIQLRGRVLEEQKLGLESAWMLEGMPVSYRIELDEQEWGQLLDGLECRAESWRRAAEYLRTEEMPDGEFFIIEECSDEDEADGLATCYEAIIQNIQTQMEDQL